MNVDEAADGVTVAFPDVPEAVTFGETRTEAEGRALEALLSGLSMYVDANQRVPAASPARGRPVVAVPALEAVKLALHDAMLAEGVTNAALARRLGCDEKAVRRLRDVLHRSKIEQIEAALAALGKRIEITVRQAA